MSIERIKEILKGIDVCETDSDDGWWPTSTGAEFGARKLRELERFLADQAQDAEPVAKITNRMKAECHGEFQFDVEQTCSACHYDEPQDDCEVCQGEVVYMESITVPWDTCKKIYKRMVKFADTRPPAANQGVPEVEPVGFLTKTDLERLRRGHTAKIYSPENKVVTMHPTTQVFARPPQSMEGKSCK